MRSAVVWIFLSFVVAGVAVVSASDFNKDGKVDFADFVQFASRYGAAAGDERYHARYDLDGDGKIGFGDYTLMAEQFGVGEHADKRAVTSDELERAAKDLRASGKSKESIEKYKALLGISRSPRQRARAINQLGWLHVKTNDLDTAESYFNSGIEAFDGSEDLRLGFQVMWCNIGMGKIHLARGNTNTASAYFAMASRQVPAPPSSE